MRLMRQAIAAGRVARANVARLKRPLKLNFALTYWCQYRCKTCNIWQRKPTDELTTAEVLQFIDRNRKFSWVDLTGGEIFLRADISDIFDAVVASWRELVVLHFPTNGFLTDTIVRIAERVAHQGIPRVIVTVSLDGDAETNDEVRGIKGGFERQMETFAALHQMDGIEAVLGMTLSRHNVGQVERTFAACQRRYQQLTREDFHVNLAQTSEHYYGNSADTSPVAPRDAALRELRAHRDQRAGSLSVSRWIEDRYLRELERFLETGVTPMRCHALRSSCFVDPWGTVFPCISYTRPLGRLRETNMMLDSIWQEAGTALVQREIWQGNCPHCWTACEAYQSILGNVIRPLGTGPRARPTSVVPLHPIADTPSSRSTNGGGS